ncbi:hypothetical protein HED22_19545, partial [Thalassospira sp. HF15]|uniref:hypothetical protein n=1 Tax=Thalassospira sp. HF15 TaxID=2722755 RepID=UPI00169026A9
MFGWSTNNAGSSYEALSYGLYLTSDGTVYVYESGVNRGHVGGTYAIGDVLNVSRNSSGQVTYSKNGAVFYTSGSSVPTGTALWASAAMHEVGGTLTNLNLAVDGAEVEEFSWVLDPGLELSATNVAIDPESMELSGTSGHDVLSGGSFGDTLTG